jgi:hypothetical protein
MSLIFAAPAKFVKECRKFNVIFGDAALMTDILPFRAKLFDSANILMRANNLQSIRFADEVHPQDQKLQHNM